MATKFQPLSDGELFDLLAEVSLDRLSGTLAEGSYWTQRLPGSDDPQGDVVDR